LADSPNVCLGFQCEAMFLHSQNEMR